MSTTPTTKRVVIPSLRLAVSVRRIPRVQSVPRGQRRPAPLERGDWLAVPLCILWGIGLWMWPLVTTGPASGQAGGGNPLSFLWEVPLTVARFLLGG